MTKKVDRAVHGPTWTEVILGALLSLILGAVLGALLLIFRPVTVARELPKEPEKRAVYYIEGSRETGRGREAPAKRKAFIAGQSVTLNEEEINALIAASRVDVEKKGAEKPKDGKGAEAAGGGNFVVGAPVVRIADGEFQIGAPVTIDLLGQKIIAQARGGFEKDGQVFVFKPAEMYLGSCPLQRLPLLAGLLRSKFAGAQPIPEDLMEAWQKLAAVSVQGKTLKLTMP